jgi:hypothetical protein
MAIQNATAFAHFRGQKPVIDGNWGMNSPAERLVAPGPDRLPEHLSIPFPQKPIPPRIDDADPGRVARAVAAPSTTEA